jgi:hypothetical protein
MIFLFPQSFQGTELLIRAYEDSSSELYNEFFNRWENDSKPLSNNEYNQLSDTLKEIYNLFYEFYYPQKMIYPYDFETDYYVLQNEIQVFIVSNSIEDTFFYKIGFNKKELAENNVKYIFKIKPKIKFHDKKILYLTTEYEKYINDFLFYNTEDIVKLRKGEERCTKIAAVQKPRVDFLKPKIHCIPHHWISAFWYYTFPYIEYIFIRDDLKIAQVGYRIDSSMHRVNLYKKINKEWLLVYKESNGIE